MITVCQLAQGARVGPGTQSMVPELRGEEVQYMERALSQTPREWKLKILHCIQLKWEVSHAILV